MNINDDHSSPYTKSILTKKTSSSFLISFERTPLLLRKTALEVEVFSKPVALTIPAIIMHKNTRTNVLGDTLCIL